MKKTIILPKSIAILFECGILDSIVSLSTDNKKFVYYSEFGKREKINVINLDEIHNFKNLSTCLIFSESADDVLLFKKNISSENLDSRLPYVFLNSENFSDNILLDSSRISRISNRYFLNYTNLDFHRSTYGYDYDLSIIVPIYGVENFIEKCARSLMEQDFCGKYEVLFIDDGSKDNSVSKLKNIIDEVPFMKILSKKNGGAASARNYGMNFAKGEYIAFVDGDDYVSYDYVQVLYKNAFLNNADISQASFSYVNITENSSHVHKEYFPTFHDKFSDAAICPYKLMLQTPGIWRRAYKKSFLIKNNIKFNENFKRHDDLPFNIEVLSKASNVAVSDSVIYYYILGRDGQDVGATDERLFIHFDLFDDAIKLVQAKYWDSTYYEIFIITMFSHHLWAYNRINQNLKKSYLYKMGKQVFLEPGPIGPLGRLRILTSFFKEQRNLVLKSFLSTLSAEHRPKMLKNFLGSVNLNN